jgi:hypothetical protein
MFIEERMAGSKSLILCETSITPTPFFLRSLTTLSKKREASNLVKYLEYDENGQEAKPIRAGDKADGTTKPLLRANESRS